MIVFLREVMSSAWSAFAYCNGLHFFRCCDVLASLWKQRTLWLVSLISCCPHSNTGYSSKYLSKIIICHKTPGTVVDWHAVNLFGMEILLQIRLIRCSRYHWCNTQQIEGNWPMLWKHVIESNFSLLFYFSVTLFRLNANFMKTQWPPS